MRRIAALAIAVGLVAAACGADEAATPVPGDDVDAAVFAGSVSGVDGNDVDLAAFAETDAVVWFWAPW